MTKPSGEQEGFTGNIAHSNKHTRGTGWKGKQTLVVGACTSAHNVSFRVSYRRLVIYL
jgi:cation diffusion facilitator CzcD-associated flavoprotein CzcO